MNKQQPYSLDSDGCWRVLGIVAALQGVTDLRAYLVSTRQHPDLQQVQVLPARLHLLGVLSPVCVRVQHEELKLRL